MAQLEYINYVPHRAVVLAQRVEWLRDFTHPLSGLPQIFWSDGTPWAEANHWALDKARSGDVKLKTVQSLMKHLHQYASWIEEGSMDWRHFPMRKSDRVLVVFRGALVAARNAGHLRPSTATARMRAVIQFYRHCNLHNFVTRGAPMWKDKLIVMRYYDSCGFERTMGVLSTDLSIPNRARPGVRLEGGLLPISASEMNELLKFTSENVCEELHLILMTGFFTGARLETITTLRVESLETASTDPLVPGMWKIRVGPGTVVATKGDVSGSILVADQLMRRLMQYAYSSHRIKRVEKAAKEDKSRLFLTRFSNPYGHSAISRGMTELRRIASQHALKFMKNFRFHQSRATFGTWLMSILLGVPGIKVKTAIEFVRDAMLHAREADTMRYITFLEHTRAKIEIANAFSEAFLGIASRLGDRNA
ncbi:site-specific integrase [Geomonas sp. RF6]|uniref:site-specific integrase n=1 Tax=Geomonas sp. RF6 TaxID=2897342 RepID=UPI001E3D409C|nr:site-specific integrase [Geomonas sp. RF6]UFS72487.1 site-specific integrase [Geomonas sp. RF6]